MTSANDEVRSKRGGYLLLGASVPKVGTSNMPFYLQPAGICTDQSGQGKHHTHFPGKATRPAGDVLGTHAYNTIFWFFSSHTTWIPKQPQHLVRI